MIAENASYYAELDQRHKELVGETVEIGLMFASKAFVQLLINPVVGLLTYRYENDSRVHLLLLHNSITIEVELSAYLLIIHVPISESVTAYQCSVASSLCLFLH